MVVLNASVLVFVPLPLYSVSPPPLNPIFPNLFICFVTLDNGEPAVIIPPDNYVVEFLLVVFSPFEL